MLNITNLAMEEQFGATSYLYRLPWNKNLGIFFSPAFDIMQSFMEQGGRVFWGWVLMVRRIMS